MAALNIFGKKAESAVEAEGKKEKLQKKEVVIKEKRTEAQEKTSETVAKDVAQKERGGAKVTAGSQLIRAHITEKATDLASRNQYVFVVTPGASKKEIEHSVENAYGVVVKGVQIINVRAKSMRLGKTRGTKSGYKKAIVTVKEGQTIEVLPT